MTDRAASGRFVAALAALAWALGVIFYWPGNLSADGTIQWYEGRFAEISHTHPAFLSFVWHWLDLVYPGPGPMLTLQLAVFWLACGVLLSWLSLGRMPTLLAWAFLAAFPFLIAHDAVVIKDVMAGNFALLGFCILLFYPRTTARSWLILAAFAAFGCAGLFRYQLWLAAPPAIAGVLLLDLRAGAGGWVAVRHGALAAVVLLATIVAADAAMERVFTYRRTAAGQVIQQGMLYDIAAIAAHEPQRALDVFDRLGVDTAELKRRARLLYSTERLDYVVKSGNAVVEAPGAPAVWVAPIDQLLDQVSPADLRRQWLDLLWRDPGAFIGQRVDTFARLLGLGELYACQPFVTVGFTRSPPELWQALQADWLRPSLAAGSLLRWRYFPANTPIFRPVSYLLVSVLLAALMLRRRSAETIIPSALLVAAWLYWASYIPLPVACDIRYSYFSCLAVIAVALACARTLRRQAGAPAPRPYGERA